MNGIVAVKNYGFEWYLQVRRCRRTEAAERDAPPGHRLGGRPEPARPAARRARSSRSCPARRTRTGASATPSAAGTQGLRGDGGVLPARALRGPAGPAADRRRRVGPMERFGWYVGLCPTSDAYLAERAAVMRGGRRAASSRTASSCRSSASPASGSCGCRRRRGRTSPSTASATAAWRGSVQETGHALPAGPTAASVAPSSATSCEPSGRPGSAAVIAGVIETLGDAAGASGPASRCSSTAWRWAAATTTIRRQRGAGPVTRGHRRAWPTTSS